jgi:hypothetical protein
MWNDTVTEAIRHFPDENIDLTSLGYGVCDINTPEKRTALAGRIRQDVKYLAHDERQQRCQALAALAQNLPDNLMMTTEQLQAMHDAGMEIGGHTASHPILASLSDAEAYTEMARNKQVLESKLTAPIRFFAYPNGKLDTDYTAQHVDMLKQLGYQAAVSTTWGVNNAKTDRWQLARFTPWDTQLDKFMLRMALMYRHVKQP